MATLTLKNVPEELVERLKRQAAEHHRSLNQEAISQLQASIALRSDEEIRRVAERIRATREQLRAKGIWLDHSLVRELIEEGRPLRK